MHVVIEAAPFLSLSGGERFRVICNCCSEGGAPAVDKSFVTYEEALLYLNQEYSEEQHWIDFFQYWEKGNPKLAEILSERSDGERNDFIYRVLCYGRPTEWMIAELTNDKKALERMATQRYYRGTLHDSVERAIGSMDISRHLEFRDGHELCLRSGISVGELMDKLYASESFVNIVEELSKSLPVTEDDVDACWSFFQELLSPCLSKEDLLE